MSLEEVEVGHSTCQPSYLELSLHSALYAYWGVLGVSSHKIMYVVLGGAHFAVVLYCAYTVHIRGWLQCSHGHIIIESKVPLGLFVLSFLLMKLCHVVFNPRLCCTRTLPALTRKLSALFYSSHTTQKLERGTAVLRPWRPRTGVCASRSCTA